VRFSGPAVDTPIGAVVSESDCRTTVVLPVDLRERLVERAQAADRSISAEIRVALREHVGQPASSAAPDRHALAAAPGEDAALDVDEMEAA
jgi:hypothetical protein